MTTGYLDELREQVNDGLEAALRRVKRLLPDDAAFEEAAFGVESPQEKAKREHQEEAELKADPPTGDEPWRAEFRRNWPDGPRTTKRWSR